MQRDKQENIVDKSSYFSYLCLVILGASQRAAQHRATFCVLYFASLSKNLKIIGEQVFGFQIVGSYFSRAFRSGNDKLIHVDKN